MADFKTHAAVGIVGSGMLATLALATEIVPRGDLISLAFAGALGSILPDIDLQNSRASRALFNMSGIFLAFAVLFNFAWQYSIAEMWVVWLFTLFMVRVVIQWLFHRFAHHRGIFHSVLAAVLFGFLGAAMFFHVFKSDPIHAWLAGVFVFYGYIIHLVLDEIYSVDFTGVRVKRSFGTALKIIEWRSPICSISMAAAVALVFMVTPPFKEFAVTVGTPEIWAFVGDRFLPANGWFEFIGEFSDIARYINPNDTDPTITGSITTPNDIQPVPAEGSAP